MSKDLQDRTNMLVEQSLNLIEFLEDVDALKVLYSGDIINKAIYRYKEYWLPLLARNINNWQQIYPPIDVAWVWHCHMLCPTRYAQDCMELFGRVLPHQHISKGEREYRQNATKKIWENEYNASFRYQSENSIGSDEEFLKGKPSKISYNLKEASLRQKEFYYQVSLPHYKEREYLKLSVLQYFKFLKLKALKNKLFIVPTYAIDVVWHAHQCDPLGYEYDCNAILGYLLPHDDTVADRSPGSKLDNSYEETSADWLKLYKENYFFEGGMYRGEAKFMHYSNKGFNFHKSVNAILAPRTTEIQLSKMNLDNIFGKSKGNMYVSVGSPFVKSIYGEISISKPLKVSVNNSQSSLNIDKILQINIAYKFDESFIMSLKNLFTKSESYKKNNGSIIVEIAKPKKILEIVSDTQQISDKHSNHFSLASEWKLFTEADSLVSLKLQTTAFLEINVSQNLKEFPVFDFQDLNYGNDDALIARHSLYIKKPNSDDYRSKYLTVEVLHIISTQWSSIRILNGDKTLASAQLINNSQLPTFQQVKKAGVPCLEANERAVLVKNALGDFAIVKGSKQRGMLLQYYLLKQDTKKDVRINKDQVQLFEENLDLRFDYKTGDISIGFNKDDMEELKIESMLAVVFSMSLLHVQLLPKELNSTRIKYFEKEINEKLLLSSIGN